MVAALLVAGTFGLPGFELLRLVTFGVVGLAPLAFLSGCWTRGWPVPAWPTWWCG